MGRFLAVMMLTNAVFSPVTLAFSGQTQTAPAPAGPVAAQASSPATPVPYGIPPRPSGKSTVIGGVIHNIDPVRDQFSLKVFGGKPMKILFDERTQVYRDGKRTALRSMHTDDHASVETILDGTKVFALSIHVLSQLPEGECQGQVIDFNPASRELTVSDALGKGPLKLRLTSDATIVRAGKAASVPGGGVSDLVKGALVAVNFKSDSQGHGLATQVSVLATPGSSFVFTGNITFLDLRAKVLVVADPANDKTYKISFDPDRLPIARDLHEGQQATVTATFESAGYMATAITVQ